MYNLRNWKTERLSNLPKVTQLYVALPGFEWKQSARMRKNKMLTYVKPHPLNFHSVSVCLCVNVINAHANWVILHHTDATYTHLNFNIRICTVLAEYSPWISEVCLFGGLWQPASLVQGSLSSLKSACKGYDEWETPLAKPAQRSGLSAFRPETELSRCASIILPDLSRSQLAVDSHWAPTVYRFLY